MDVSPNKGAFQLKVCLETALHFISVLSIIPTPAPPCQLATPTSQVSPFSRATQLLLISNQVSVYASNRHSWAWLLWKPAVPAVSPGLILVSTNPALPNLVIQSVLCPCLRDLTLCFYCWILDYFVSPAPSFPLFVAWTLNLPGFWLTSSLTSSACPIYCDDSCHYTHLYSSSATSLRQLMFREMWSHHENQATNSVAQLIQITPDFTPNLHWMRLLSALRSKYTKLLFFPDVKCINSAQHRLCRTGSWPQKQNKALGLLSK